MRAGVVWATMLRPVTSRVCLGGDRSAGLRGAWRVRTSCDFSVSFRGGAVPSPVPTNGRMGACPSKPKPKVVVIAGPTAVGKTALGVALALHCGGEVIAADSATVYRGMDVGTAKPTAEERQGVPHHLMDVVDPWDGEMDAADWLDRAEALIEDIAGRGKVPVVVGGAQFYLTWLCQGRPRTPPSNPDVRNRISRELQRDGSWAESLERLRRVDAEAAEKLMQNDYFRLARKLEIVELSGRSNSSFLPEQSWESPHDLRCYVLDMPHRRAQLYQRIDWRCEKMVMDSTGPNLLTECVALAGKLEASGFDKGIQEARGRSIWVEKIVGYRQGLDFLRKIAEAKRRGGAATVGAESFRTFLWEFQAASRNLAQMQLKSFRKQSVWRWMDAQDGTQRLLGAIAEELELDAEAFRAAREDPAYLAEQVKMRRSSDGLQKQMREYGDKIYRLRWFHGNTARGRQRSDAAAALADRLADAFAAL